MACAERHTPEGPEVKGVGMAESVAVEAVAAEAEAAEGVAAEAVAAEAVVAEAVAALLATDQLRREMREGRAFAGFSEAPISFALP